MQISNRVLKSDKIGEKSTIFHPGTIYNRRMRIYVISKKKKRKH